MALGSKAEVCSLVQLGMTMSRGSGWDKKWAPTAGVSGRAGGGSKPGEFSFKYLDFSEESACRFLRFYETQVRSLGQGDPLEKEMATHSSILAWKVSGTEESCGLQSVGSQRVRHD